MRMRRFAVLLVLLELAACGNGDSSGEGDRAAQNGGLSEEQMEHGIGPVRDIDLADLDATLAARGGEVFTMKCSACHKANDRYVGPALGDVLTRREPEYVMNMILNPAEMLEKHPEARKLLAEYMTPMPNQNLTQDDARAVLEYLRSLAGGDEESTEEQ